MHIYYNSNPPEKTYWEMEPEDYMKEDPDKDETKLRIKIGITRYFYEQWPRASEFTKENSDMRKAYLLLHGENGLKLLESRIAQGKRPWLVQAHLVLPFTQVVATATTFPPGRRPVAPVLRQHP